MRESERMTLCAWVCVCVYPEACVWLSWCLEMFWWEAQGSLARPQDSTVPINQPSSLQLYWPYLETERETDGDGGGGMSWDTARQSGLEGTPKKGLRGWKGEKENEQRTHFTTSQHFCKCLLTYHYSTLISLHTHFHLRLPSLQMRGNNFRKKKDPASLFRNGGTESVHLTGLETFKW